MRVVLNVTDFDAVVRFYRDIMEFKMVGGWDRGPDDQGALLEVTPGAVVEIVGHGPAFSEPSYHHDAIALEVDNPTEVDGYFARLTAAGHGSSDPTMQPWQHYSASFRDPVGLEIVVYADESATFGI